MTFEKALSELSCNCRINDTNDRQIIASLAGAIVSLQSSLAALQEDLSFLKASDARRAQSAAEGPQRGQMAFQWYPEDYKPQS